MKMIKADYASFKSIVQGSPVYFHYQSYVDTTELWTQKDNTVMYHCTIDNDGADQTDFDTWSWQAGDWDWKSRTWEFDFSTTGSNIVTWRFTNDSNSNELAMLLNGIVVAENYNDGDRIKFRVVDNQGLYAPAGYVFREFVDRELSTNTPVIEVNPKEFEVPSRSKIFKGLDLELEYIKKTGGSLTARILASLDYEYKTQPV